MPRLRTIWRSWREALRDRERPWRDAPLSARLAFLATLLCLLAINWQRPAPQARPEQLPPAPAPAILRTFALGDALAANRLAALWLQAFDVQPGVALAFASFPKDRLLGWLDSIHRLAADTDYAVFLAANVYFASQSESLRRAIIPWVRERFRERPDSRWREMARLAQLTKQHLNDTPLAIELARDIRLYATGQGVPDWARQMEAFLYEAAGDDISAAALIAMFLKEGGVRDESEKRFLEQRLIELHERIEKRHKDH